MILGGFFLASDAEAGSPPFAQPGTVVLFVDPVTLDLRLPNGPTERVQLYAVTAPAPTNCSVAHATADAASLALGKSVWLVAVQGRPPKNSGRPLLAYVILPGGVDLGLLLVKRGDATVRTDQRPFPQRAVYVRAEKAAQAASLGLWGCTTGGAAGAPTTTTTTTPDHGHGQGQGQAQGQGHGSSDQAGSGHGPGNGKT